MADPVPSRTLYVSDLDRTLLRSDGTVSAESARLLNSVIETGALFTYATARSFLSSRKATNALRLRLPVITYGGTITADPDSGQPLDLRLLSGTVVDAVLDLCLAARVEPILHTFENRRDWVRWRPEQETPGVRAFLTARPNDPRLRPITPTDPLDTRTVFYISLLASTPALTALRARLPPPLDGLAHFLSVDPSTPGLDWLELHHLGGTKAQAIRRLMTDLGADRLVVFGDNHNDLPMFEIADQSYAVSNAVPAVLTAATGIIASNDNDAVAHWIDTEHRKTTPKITEHP